MKVKTLTLGIVLLLVALGTAALFILPKREKPLNAICYPFPFDTGGLIVFNPYSDSLNFCCYPNVHGWYVMDEAGCLRQSDCGIDPVATMEREIQFLDSMALTAAVFGNTDSIKIVKLLPTLYLSTVQGSPVLCAGNKIHVLMLNFLTMRDNCQPKIVASRNFYYLEKGDISKLVVLF